MQPKFLPENNMGRNVAIDRLRGLAIILVLGLHFFDLSVFDGNGGGHDRNYVYRLFSHGYLGVTIFFVISGCLIASTSIKTINSVLLVDIPRFYIRRATRIFPLLLLAVAAGVVVLHFAGDQSENRIFQYLFLVPGTVFTAGFWLSIAAFCFNWFRVFAGGQTHGWFGLQWDVLWSLSVEEQFYLVFPWLVTLCGTVRRLRSLMLFVVVFCVFARLLLVLPGSPLLSNFANSVVCFDALAIGVLVALSSPWSTRRSRGSIWAGAVLLVFSYLCGSTVLAGLPTFLMALSIGLLIQGSRDLVGPLGGFADPVLPAFGKLSYGLYLLHPVAFFVIAPVAVVSVNPLLGFLIALGAVFVIAMISFNLFERPVERSLRAWLYRIIASRSGAHNDGNRPADFPSKRRSPGPTENVTR